MPLTAAATLIAAGLAADAQPRIPGGPTPGEQAGMHQGAPATSGSSTLIRDRDGVHLDGYPHMAVVVFPDGHMGPVRRGHQHDQRYSGG
ncbi:MAG TPA: hypothetical protein VGH86_13785 [Phenylobacterium sp.]